MVTVTVMDGHGRYETWTKLERNRNGTGTKLELITSRFRLKTKDLMYLTLIHSFQF